MQLSSWRYARASNLRRHRSAAAQLDGYDQQYAQLSRGRFRGAFSSFSLRSGICVDVERVNQAMHQNASVPRDMVSVVTFLETSGFCILNGQTLAAGDSIILQPGAGLELRTPENMSVAVVSMPRALVDQEACILLGPDESWRGSPSPIGLRSSNMKGSMFSEMLSLILQEVVAKPKLLGDDRHRAVLGDTILNGLFLAVTSAEEGRLEIMHPTRPWEVFMAAKHAFDGDPTVDVSILGLCKAAGVSRRTLEYCFESVIGLSPLQYLKVRRLNGIRSELSAADPNDVTIGDIAARYGVWHLSRLAAQYRALFGELPSATLKQGRS